MERSGVCAGLGEKESPGVPMEICLPANFGYKK
jgi:hypothetical protein